MGGSRDRAFSPSRLFLNAFSRLALILDCCLTQFLVVVVVVFTSWCRLYLKTALKILFKTRISVGRTARRSYTFRQLNNRAHLDFSFWKNDNGAI